MRVAPQLMSGHTVFGSQELPVLPIIDYSEAQIEEIRRKQREAYQNEGECASEEEIEG